MVWDWMYGCVVNALMLLLFSTISAFQIMQCKRLSGHVMMIDSRGFDEEEKQFMPHVM